MITKEEKKTLQTFAINKELYRSTCDVSDDQITYMINDLDIGNFDKAVIMLSKMTQDSRLSGVLDCRAFNLMDSKISVIGGENYKSDTEIIQKAIDNAEKEIQNWYTNTLMLGVGLLQIITTQSEDRYNFRLQNYEPHGLRYDLKEDLYFLITSLKEQDEDEKAKRIEALKSTKGYISLAEYRKNFDVEIITDNRKWIVAENGTKGFKQAFIRSLVHDWYTKKLAIADLLNWSQKSAGPILKLKVPAASDFAVNKTFATSVKNIEKYGVITLPQSANDEASYDAEYMEVGTSSTSYTSYSSTIDAANANYAIKILSNNLSTEIQAGAQASVSIHREKELQLAKSDKQFVQSILNDQLLSYYRYVNNADYDGQILVNIDRTDEILQKLQTLQTLTNTNANIAQTGYQIDFGKLIGELGLDCITKKIDNV